MSANNTIPCRICGQPTLMLGTKLCDRCWELETRIKHDPEIARRILGDTPGTLSLRAIRFAIVANGGRNLGRCYNQTDLLIYSQDNVDDTRYDDVYAEERKSYNRRKRLLEFLPRANAGQELSKFNPVPDIPGLFVAHYYYRTDSSD